MTFAVRHTIATPVLPQGMGRDFAGRVVCALALAAWCVVWSTTEMLAQAPSGIADR